MQFYLRPTRCSAGAADFRLGRPFSTEILKIRNGTALKAQGGAKGAPKCAKGPPSTPKVAPKSRTRYLLSSTSGVDFVWITSMLRKHSQACIDCRSAVRLTSQVVNQLHEKVSEGTL